MAKIEKKQIIGILIIIGAILLIMLSSDIDEFKPLQNFVLGEEEKEPVVLKNITDIRVYKFYDLHNDTVLNVEVWIKNMGRKTLENIDIFVRARNQNGTVIFSDFIYPEFNILRYNETATAIYSVPIEEGDIFVMHTIELEWEDGRVAYVKETNL